MPLLILFLLTNPVFSAEKPYIAVGSAKTKKAVIAFPNLKLKDASAETAESAKIISETVRSDLEFMAFFHFMEPAAFVEDTKTAGITLDTFKLSDWTSIGVEFLAKASLAREGNVFTLEARVYDTFGGRQVLGKRYVSTVSEVKTLAHTLANEMVEALTGLSGIFLTKIAMSCDRNSRRKEIYMMDFDGTNAKQITQHGSIAFAPAWNSDGTKIAYSLFTKHKNNIRNIDLYEYDFNSSTVRMLSNRKGINSGAAYSPDGKKIALTMSFLGNPEIFALDPNANTVTRLTSSFGVDVDPAWSPDGKHLAFVSSRTGMPMLYSMALDGSKTQRLTFAGRYNATPTWSPQNNKIGFAGWIDGRFDVFIMNPDGTRIERLTKDQGNNEDPYFSPDGNFVVFSSNRTGQSNVYVMNVDGTFVKRLTYGLGNCVAPKWSGIPRKK